MLVGFLEEAGRWHVKGWAAKRGADGEVLRTNLRVVYDGSVVSNIEPNIYRRDLFESGIGDGSFGFNERLKRPIVDKSLLSIVGEDGRALSIVETSPTPNNKSISCTARRLVKYARKLLTAIAVNVGGRFIYTILSPAVEKYKLRGYTHNIIENKQIAPSTHRYIAALVYYEPDGEVSQSIKNITSALIKKNVGIVLMVNANLSKKQRDYFENTVDRIVRRGNVGFDFGCYKDFFTQIAPLYSSADRIILINDSVYYIQTGLSEMITGLLGDEDVIAAFENWGEDHHLQSFCISYSRRVAFDAKFTDWWKKYTPVSNRAYAIENGEKALSRISLKLAKTTRVLYSVGEVSNAIVEDHKDNAGRDLNPRTVPEPWRGHVFSSNGSLDTEIERLISIIGSTSPIHAGAFFFPYYMNAPMIKKDIVYRGRFSFWEVETWTSHLMKDNERIEFLQMLRAKSDFSALSSVNRIKYHVGVK